MQSGCFLYSSPKAGLNAVPTVKITLGTPFPGDPLETIPADHVYAASAYVQSAVCLFTPQLSLVVVAPTHGGMARLS